MFSKGSEYDSSGRVSNCKISASVLGSKVETRSQYFYDSKGMLVKKIMSDSRDNYSKKQEVFYSDYKFDSHGNWISRKKDGDRYLRVLDCYFCHIVFS